METLPELLILEVLLDQLADRLTDSSIGSPSALLEIGVRLRRINLAYIALAEPYLARDDGNCSIETEQ